VPTLGQDAAFTRLGTIVARLAGAPGATSVAGADVAVVALLVAGKRAIAAAGDTSGILARTNPAVFDDAVATAAVVGARVAVIALFAIRTVAVAANFAHAAIDAAHESIFDGAVAIAAVAVVDVAVIALLASGLDAIATARSFSARLAWTQTHPSVFYPGTIVRTAAGCPRIVALLEAFDDAI